MLISWISNVSGRLFFNLTDPYSYRMDRIVGDVIHLNKKIDRTRYLFVSMLVDLRDEAEPNSTEFTRVVLWAKADFNDDELPTKFEGAIYFFDDFSNPGLEKSTEEKEIVTNFKKLAKKESAKSLQDQIKTLVELYENKKGIEKGKEKIIDKVNFKIYANGIIELNQSSLWGTTTTEQKNPAIKQAFYFIKFLFHKDRFHSQSNEGIIRIIETKKSFDQYTSEEIVGFTKELLAGIKRYVAENRKQNAKSPIVLQQLKGVIVYANSLISIMESTIGNIENHTKEQIREIAYEKQLIENLNDSIDMELSQKPLRPVNVYQFISELQTLSAIALAIIAPFIIITYQTMLHEYDEKIKTTDELLGSYMATLISYYGIWFVAAVILVVILKWTYDGTFKSSYVLTLVDFIWKKGVYYTRKLSNPSIIKPAYLDIVSYPAQWFTKIEMSIRRSKDSFKVFLAICAILFSISIYKATLHVYPEDAASFKKLVSEIFYAPDNNTSGNK